MPNTALRYRISNTLAWLLLPPLGDGARELTALIFLCIGIPRMMSWSGTTLVDYIPSWVYGIALSVCAILLLATICTKGSLSGRFIAIIGVFLSATLASDAWPSVAPTLLYIVLSYALIGQAGANYDD